MSYVPLRFHTEYSVGSDGAPIKEYVRMAVEYGLSGLALTDRSTMAGVPGFLRALAKDAPSLKPVIGLELNVSTGQPSPEDNPLKPFYPAVFLARNLTGYHNLCRLASMAASAPAGNPDRVVPHEVLPQYRDGLICISAFPDGEIAGALGSLLLEQEDAAAEWNKGVFGDDFYIEVKILEDPYLSDELFPDGLLADELFNLAERHSVKVVASVADRAGFRAGDAVGPHFC